MKEYQNIEQIILRCQDDIEKDIKTLKFVKNIDFLDIFPKSIEHKELLDEEALGVAKLIKKTDRGNFYVFNEPVQTKFGPLKIIKIRFFDETRLNWVAAPDFSTINYQKFLNFYKEDDRFSYIERPDYSGLEFKTDKSLIYFLEELTTDYFGIK